jgi:hypothetical protein
LNRIKNLLNTKSSKVNLAISCLVMPSLLLPIKYSSILLLIICVALILNKRKSKFSKFLLYPFIGYFVSIIISFFIDLTNGVSDFDFLLRNIIILIIPVFVFTSNFSKLQIIKLLRYSSGLISILGLFFLFFWVSGYYNFNNKQEFQKKDWFKNQIITSKNNLSKDSLFKIIIEPSSKKPSLRNVAMFSGDDSKKLIIRELTIKVKKSKQDVWVLFRNINNGNCKVWFNATNGKTGLIQGDAIVESEKLANGFFKFTLSNKVETIATREWFYVSFVSQNGLYEWSSGGNAELQLATPKFYLDSGKNLLKNKAIFKHKISEFSNLGNYAHSTYFALVFTFALIILFFNSFSNVWIRYFFILTNIIVIFTFASKAVILSLIILFPIYYFYHYFNYRSLIMVVLIGFLLSLNGHVRERLVDMYQTINNVYNQKELGDLAELSTNNRIKIYKNYSNLISENYIVGHGNINGKGVVKSSFSHNFNAHNQYLQSIFNSGIIGFILLIIFCISPFLIKKGIKNDKTGITFFILIILFNFIFESILYRQWGLILVSFIFSIYFQFFKSE